MNKEDFDKLIEKYRKSEKFEIIDELLEKQIVYFYSQLLIPYIIQLVQK